MSYDAINLTTPDIKWLGVRPSDLDKYSIPPQCRLEMSEHDLKTGKELLQARAAPTPTPTNPNPHGQGPAAGKSRLMHRPSALALAPTSALALALALVCRRSLSSPTPCGTRSSS